jgi:hypothetical protein
MHTIFTVLYLLQVVWAIPYSEYILAPSNRTLLPNSVHKVNGTVEGANNLIGDSSGSTTFSNGSSVTLDFGKNIAGLVTLDIASPDSGIIWLTYTESSLWINGEACDAMADAGLDAPYVINTNGSGSYTVDDHHDRGGFRYLSLINRGRRPVEVLAVSVNFTAMPHVENSAAYSGYFHSNDEKINRVWYAGAYTNQLCTINPLHGDSLVHVTTVNSTQNISLPHTNTWYLNATITNGTSALVDGAKRDRTVWPGDMSISAPGILVSTNDLVTIKNSLDSLLVLQNDLGQLPYAGVPFIKDISAREGEYVFSFTYHLYTLIGMSYYHTYTGDDVWLTDNWSRFTRALNYSISTIDSSGLMNVTSSADWLRFGMGGHNIEANSILYFTLQQGIELSRHLNDTTHAGSWATTAGKVKNAANALLWDSAGGYYRDNETTTLAPQDGNAWAIKSNITHNATQISAISTFLHDRWTPYGAPAPEAADAISPFISSFELEAHYLASDPNTALDLIRTMWADFMLDDPRMTNSTFIEGYSSNGNLHYAPYTNDPRVSHAHGWSTGPTSILTFYGAGLHLESALGQTWRIAPQPGSLESIEAGFRTDLGNFASSLTATGGVVRSLNFSTPAGTTGSVSLTGLFLGELALSGPGKNVSTQIVAQNSTWEMSGLEGGNWTLSYQPSGMSAGGSSGGKRISFGLLKVCLVALLVSMMF